MSADGPAASSPWDADYEVVELRMGRDGAPVDQLPPDKVPPVAHLDWDRRTGTIWVQGKREDGYPMGFGVRAPGGDASVVATLYVAVPLIAGTTTYTLHAGRPVRWLDLEVGQDDASISMERSYRIATARQAETRWTIDVTLEKSPPMHRWLAPLHVTIETDAPRPPWTRIAVEFQCEAPRAHAVGSFELRRLPEGAVRSDEADEPTSAHATG